MRALLHHQPRLRAGRQGAAAAAAAASFFCRQFPQELINCWREMWVQKKMGRNSYRAWLRRQRKAAEKIVAERRAVAVITRK